MVAPLLQVRRSLWALSFLYASAILWTGCDSADPVPDIASVTLSSEQVTVAVDDTVTLSAVVHDEGGQIINQPVQWRSANSAIASVDAEGVVRGVRTGSTQVIAEVGGVTGQAEVLVLEAGAQLRTFNVAAESSCEVPDNRSFRRVAVTQRAEVWADINNPAGGLTDAEYRQLGADFDRVAWPTVINTFGEPADIDGNGKVLVLYTRAVNELTERNSNSYVGGFFFGRDLFPKQQTARLGACPTSNEAEMFYMLVADPEGEVNNNVRDKALILGTSVATLAHELQHLVNASRRIFVNNAGEFEETWLDEGLSHIAEELAFYHESGLAPRSNIDLDQLRSSQNVLNAFNSYQISNFGRLSTYYRDPAANSPYAPTDSLATRGAAWQFLRFAGDRQPSDLTFFQQLGNARKSGMTNLEDALGESPVPLLRDWVVSIFADDLLPELDERYRLKSWNYRSILPALRRNENTFPLREITLTDAQAQTVNIRAGSAAYLRFGVGAGSRARIRMTVAGQGPNDTCDESSALRLAVGEVRPLEGSGPAVVCVEGELGAAFALIPFYGSLVSAETLALTVSANGINPPVPLSRPAPAPALRLEPASGGLREDIQWERVLRQRERRELNRLLGGGATTFDWPGQRAATPEQLSLILIRTN